MGDVILVIILIIAVSAAMVPTVRHFKGQGSCCGGGAYKPKKKKLKHISAQKTFQIEGMHCENCSNRVMGALNDIPGVSAVVDYKKGIAAVSYEYTVEDVVICEKIEKAGYTVRSD